MPPAPLIANPNGQRALIAGVMVAAFLVSMAGAYSLTYTPTHTQSHRSVRLGPIQMNLPNQWQEADANPFESVHPDSVTYVDKTRPNRYLAIAVVQIDEPVTPTQVAMKFLTQLAPKTATFTPATPTLNTTTGYTAHMFTIKSPSQEGLRQGLLAAVTHANDGKIHAVLYLQDIVRNEAEANLNDSIFNRLQQSVLIQQR